MFSWLADKYMEYLPGVLFVAVVAVVAGFVMLIKQNAPVSPVPEQMLGNYNYYQITAPRMYQSGIKTIEFQTNNKLIVRTDDNLTETGTWEYKNNRYYLHCSYRIQGSFRAIGLDPIQLDSGELIIHLTRIPE